VNVCLTFVSVHIHMYTCECLFDFCVYIRKFAFGFVSVYPHFYIYTRKYAFSFVSLYLHLTPVFHCFSYVSITNFSETIVRSVVT
jgi:hypothetical protein